jgi:hypothetical protein
LQKAAGDFQEFRRVGERGGVARAKEGVDGRLGIGFAKSFAAARPDNVVV